METKKSKLIIPVSTLELQGYSTEKNNFIGLLNKMFLSCIAYCDPTIKSWHTLYVKDRDNYRYVCDKCKSTVTFVG